MDASPPAKASGQGPAWRCPPGSSAEQLDLPGMFCDFHREKESGECLSRKISKPDRASPSLKPAREGKAWRVPFYRSVCTMHEKSKVRAVLTPELGCPAIPQLLHALSGPEM